MLNDIHFNISGTGLLDDVRYQQEQLTQKITENLDKQINQKITKKIIPLDTGKRYDTIINPFEKQVNLINTDLINTNKDHEMSVLKPESTKSNIISSEKNNTYSDMITNTVTDTVVKPFSSTIIPNSDNLN